MSPLSPLTLVLFVLGIGLLVAGAELLVRGASRLAVAAGVSPLVVGLTVVAFGTSSPELAVSVHGALSGHPAVALGNVIGSNVFNVLVVLGIAAVFWPLAVSQRLVRVDVPLMIGVSLAVYLMALDGAIGRLDGLVLFGGAIGYTLYAVRSARRERREIEAEYDAEFGMHDHPRLWVQLLLIAAGLGMLVAGAHWLVEGAVAIAWALGASELVISLTVVAVGTSLPELATSIIACFHGERDIAVGNVIGSNLFNLLVVLGLTAAAAPGGVPVGHEALRFDLPVMVVVALACLPVFFTRHTIDRWEGAMFVAYYGAYAAYLVMRAVRSPAIGTFDVVMLAFALPITAVTLAVLVVRSARLDARESG